mmetsp:Transcript_72378/g.198282  ORF Transcript_72378/g.198282 Transcript_72378/m.198282 type:complete len:378 (-) Transcript_72378:929-2062(-)
MNQLGDVVDQRFDHIQGWGDGSLLILGLEDNFRAVEQPLLARQSLHAFVRGRHLCNEQVDQHDGCQDQIHEVEYWHDDVARGLVANRLRLCEVAHAEQTPDGQEERKVGKLDVGIDGPLQPRHQKFEAEARSERDHQSEHEEEAHVICQHLDEDDDEHTERFVDHEVVERAQHERELRQCIEAPRPTLQVVTGRRVGRLLPAVQAKHHHCEDRAAVPHVHLVPRRADVHPEAIEVVRVELPQLCVENGTCPDPHDDLGRFDLSRQLAVVIEPWIRLPHVHHKPDIADMAGERGDKLDLRDVEVLVPAARYQILPNILQRVLLFVESVHPILLCRNCSDDTLGPFEHVLLVVVVARFRSPPKRVGVQIEILETGQSWR